MNYFNHLSCVFFLANYFDIHNCNKWCYLLLLPQDGGHFTSYSEFTISPICDPI